MFKKSILFNLSILLIFPPGLAWAQKIQSRKVMETPIAQIRFSTQIQKTFTVSPDSRRIAFVDHSIDKQQHVSIDGRDEAKYDEVVSRPLFSPDSKRITYVARKGDRKFVVIDGKEEKHYDDILNHPVFSPDSRKLAYVAKAGNKEFVVIAGRESGIQSGRQKNRKCCPVGGQKVCCCRWDQA